ncbi:MAG: acetylglutamate kinase [Clostridia bacterium]|nr:acetylglutamate kinase [Clostridia bacterium]MBR6935699.1 acetylglutamate kinase [Clostridia bacterium]
MQHEITNSERAEILVQALPYIKRYTDRVVVVKYGGNAMINSKLQEQVMEDVVLLWLIGVKVVLVHGGGPEISKLMDRLGKEVSFVDGLRVTDAETMDIVQMVLTGKINKSLVTLLESRGGNAVGISGVDGRLIEAKQKDPRLGFVGEITGVNIQPVLDLLEKGYIPVVSTVAAGADGSVYNINGDTAAAHIAGALGAIRLLLMTDIDGIRADKDDPATLIPELTREGAAELIDNGTVSGGMIPKVECCLEALRKGVKNVVIMDGRVPHSILMELLTDEGAGTLIRGE